MYCINRRPSTGKPVDGRQSGSRDEECEGVGSAGGCSTTANVGPGWSFCRAFSPVSTSRMVPEGIPLRIPHGSSRDACASEPRHLDLAGGELHNNDAVVLGAPFNAGPASRVVVRRQPGGGAWWLLGRAPIRRCKLPCGPPARVWRHCCQYLSGNAYSGRRSPVHGKWPQSAQSVESRSSVGSGRTSPSICLSSAGVPLRLLHGPETRVLMHAEAYLRQAARGRSARERRGGRPEPRE